MKTKIALDYLILCSEKNAWSFDALPTIGVFALINWVCSITANPGKLNVLKSCQQFKIYQPWCEPVRDRIGAVGKIFYQLVRDSIGPVDEIKHFQACPDIIKTSKGVVTPACRFL
jgi:hypothetical protein